MSAREDAVRDGGIGNLLIKNFSQERSLTALLVLLVIELFFPTSRGGRLVELVGGIVFSLILIARLVSLEVLRELKK